MDAVGNGNLPLLENLLKRFDQRENQLKVKIGQLVAKFPKGDQRRTSDPEICKTRQELYAARKFYGNFIIIFYVTRCHSYDLDMGYYTILEKAILKHKGYIVRFLINKLSNIPNGFDQSTIPLSGLLRYALSDFRRFNSCLLILMENYSLSLRHLEEGIKLLLRNLERERCSKELTERYIGILMTSSVSNFTTLLNLMKDFNIPADFKTTIQNMSGLTRIHLAIRYGKYHQLVRSLIYRGEPSNKYVRIITILQSGPIDEYMTPYQLCVALDRSDEMKNLLAPRLVKATSSSKGGGGGCIFTE